MRKSWKEKLNGAKPPHIAVLDKPFTGIPAGAKLFISSPRLVDDYMKAIPRGETRSIPSMRQEFAKQHKADATCPLTASIFVRIAAEAACEEMSEGKTPAEVTPFWRLVDPDSDMAKKLSCGVDFIRMMRESEMPGTRRALR